MNSHPNEGDLVLFVYDEAEDPEAVREHLRSCAACRDELSSLRRTLAELDELEPPERGDDYGARVWARIEGKIAPTSRFRVHFVLAAAAAVLLGTFLLGRLSVEPDEAAPGEIRERILLIALGDHLEESRVVLLEAVNRGEGLDRGRAEELLLASRLYRQSAHRLGDVTTADVLEELERILLDVSHGPEADQGAVRERIEERDVLFKIRVLQASLRDREKKLKVQKF
jgi:hypothetical protein